MGAVNSTFVRDTLFWTFTNFVLFVTVMFTIKKGKVSWFIVYYGQVKLYADRQNSVN